MAPRAKAAGVTTIFSNVIATANAEPVGVPLKSPAKSIETTKCAPNSKNGAYREMFAASRKKEGFLFSLERKTDIPVGAEAGTPRSAGDRPWDRWQSGQTSDRV